MQNPIQYVSAAQEESVRQQSGEDMGTQTEQVEMGVQTDEQARP